VGFKGGAVEYMACPLSPAPTQARLLLYLMKHVVFDLLIGVDRW